MNPYFIKKIPLVYPLLRFGRKVAGQTWMRLCHAACGVAPKRVFLSSF